MVNKKLSQSPESQNRADTIYTTAETWIHATLCYLFHDTEPPGDKDDWQGVMNLLRKRVH